MKQGQITIDRTFDAMVDAGLDPAATRGLADRVDAVVTYIDSRPDIFGGPVDRSDARPHGDVWHVMESIWMVQRVLAEEDAYWENRWTDYTLETALMDNDREEQG